MEIDNAIQMACMFSSKMVDNPLTEYEVLMHESNCVMLKTYFDLQTIQMKRAKAEVESGFPSGGDT